MKLPWKVPVSVPEPAHYIFSLIFRNGISFTSSCWKCSINKAISRKSTSSWWKQTQTLQILSVALVQSCTVFSWILPVLFSEMRSRLFQINVVFQIGRGYTGLFFQHTAAYILVPVGSPKRDACCNHSDDEFVINHQEGEEGEFSAINLSLLSFGYTPPPTRFKLI